MLWWWTIYPKDRLFYKLVVWATFLCVTVPTICYIARLYDGVVNVFLFLDPASMWLKVALPFSAPVQLLVQLWYTERTYAVSKNKWFAACAVVMIVAATAMNCWSISQTGQPAGQAR